MAIDPITGIIEGVIGIVNRIFPDKTEAQKQAFQVALQQMLTEKELALKQLDVNVAEASNPSIWVSGARPAILWVGAAIFAWTYLFQPMIVFVLTVAGHPVPQLPVLDTSYVMGILGTMLGFGGFRTVERLKGVIPNGK